MSFVSRRELLVQVVPRYREASRAQKKLILDEFIASTGYARKYAIRLLSHPVKGPETPIKRTRKRQYGPDLQEALRISWAATNYIGSKRLAPFLTELVPVLERYGHLIITSEVRNQLCSISPATIDRILHPLRRILPRVGWNACPCCAAVSTRSLPASTLPAASCRSRCSAWIRTTAVNSSMQNSCRTVSGKR